MTHIYILRSIGQIKTHTPRPKTVRQRVDRVVGCSRIGWVIGFGALAYVMVIDDDNGCVPLQVMVRHGTP